VTATEVVISATRITKSFGPTRALVDADLVLKRGEVVALMGANGAGKSTLVKILSGSLQPDSGHVEIDGRALALPSPHAAKAAGIATVHQATDQAGAPGLTVAENLLLDELCGGGAGAVLGRRAIRRKAAEIANRIDLDLPLDRDFADLRPAERQMIAIARAVSGRSKVLILDEPTSTLSANEAERLFQVMGRLRGTGISVLYISHRLGDIARVADRAVVLRGGRVVGDFPRPVDFTAALSAMIGRTFSTATTASSDSTHPIALSLRGIRLLNGTAPFDLDIRAGEVVAITGPLGSGKSRLLRILFGLDRSASGSVQLDGREWLSSGPSHSIAHGVFMAAEDRWRSSLLPPHTPGGNIAGTIALPHLRRWFPAGLLRRERENEAAEHAISRLGIRARGPEDLMDQLSGGNQQKVVLGRWQAEPCRLLLLDEPFQGVDVGARADLIAAIRSGQGDGATLIATSDAEEALQVADRIFVMRNHTLVASETLREEQSLIAALGAVERVQTMDVRE